MSPLSINIRGSGGGYWRNRSQKKCVNALCIGSATAVPLAGGAGPGTGQALCPPRSVHCLLAPGVGLPTAAQ